MYALKIAVGLKQTAICTKSKFARIHILNTLKRLASYLHSRLSVNSPNKAIQPTANINKKANAPAQAWGLLRIAMKMKESLELPPLSTDEGEADIEHFFLTARKILAELKELAEKNAKT